MSSNSPTSIFSALSAPPEPQGHAENAKPAQRVADARPDGLALREPEPRHSRTTRTASGSQPSRLYVPNGLNEDRPVRRPEPPAFEKSRLTTCGRFVGFCLSRTASANNCSAQ